MIVLELHEHKKRNGKHIVQKRSGFSLMIVPHYEGKVRKIVITPVRIYTAILVVAIFLATFVSLAYSYGNMSKKVAQINVMGGDPVTADAQAQELQILQNTIAKQKAELDALKTYVVSLSKLENQVRSSLKLGPSTVTLESLLAQAPKSATLQSFTDVPKTVAQFLTEESDTTQIAQDKQKLLTDLNTAATTLNIKLAETPNIWPLQGYISSPFGWRSNPFGGGGYEFHTGIDIVAYYGAPIRAAADG
ncbi:MAG: hypothetical protein ACP5QX_07420, partial [Caldisericaceae bacterium]